MVLLLDKEAYAGLMVLLLDKEPCAGLMMLLLDKEACAGLMVLLLDKDARAGLMVLVLDKLHNPRLCLTILVAVALATFVAVLEMGLKPAKEAQLMLLASVLGLAVFPIIPVALELASSVVRHVPLEVSAPVLGGITQVRPAAT